MTQKHMKTCKCRWILVFLTLALILGVSNLGAEVATQMDARQVGQNWLNYIVFETGAWNITATPQLLNAEEIVVEGQMLGYYFPVEPSGYIVVPVLKELPAIKTYSETDRLDMSETQGMAGLVKDVLQHRINAYINLYGSLDAVQPQSGDVLLGREHRERWAQLLVSESEFMADLYAQKMTRATTVGPLTTTVWHQGDPYNDLCPVGDNGCVTCPSGGSPGDRTVVGCVATAAAQIMKYWDWPPSGIGANIDFWDGDQSCGDDVGAALLPADFSDPYDWDNILDSYGGSPTQAEIDAVAELCYEVAVAFNMDFGVCGSGATTSDALFVYPTYFRYNAGTIDKEDRSDHDAATWFTIMQNEINGGQPVQYRIYGHSIVCDGWRDTGPEDEIHMNYGWGGSQNTWYTIDNFYCNWDGCDPAVEYLIRGIRPDNLPPVAECTDVTVYADENCEADASIDDGSYDPEGYPLTYTQSPAGPYQLGVTYVTLTVTDPQGASDACHAYVTVVDVTPPTPICPANITQANDVDLCSAVVTFAISATDNCPGVTVAAVPPSGSVFPVGETEVTVTATDGSGNTDDCLFTVAVVDTQNPVVTCPDEVEVTFINPSEATAEFEATATDNCDADPTVWCDPPSGSTFYIGANTITCYAEDEAENKDTCDFTFVLAYVDIKPGSCPNAFNIKPYTYDEATFMSSGPEMPSDQSDDLERKPEGVLPVAILGLEDFEVRDILPETILLNGVPPIRWEYEDVATPAETEDGYCGCNTERGDGFMDLTLKFKAEEIVDALGAVNDGDVVQLILTADLISGLPLYGGDCVLIRGTHTGDVTAGNQPVPTTMSVELIGASPNPFNPTTVLSFRLSQPAGYKMTIFNITGQVVETLTGAGQSGLNQVAWDGSDYTSGVYFYRLDALGFTYTKKMLLIK
jgi:hypothetical protein